MTYLLTSTPQKLFGEVTKVLDKLANFSILSGKDIPFVYHPKIREKTFCNSTLISHIPKVIRHSSTHLGAFH